MTWPTKQANKGRYAIFAARPAGVPIPRLPQRVPGVANPCRASQRSRPRRRALRRQRQDRSTAPSVENPSRPRADSAAIAGLRWHPLLPSRPSPRSRAWHQLSPCPCCLRENFRRRSPSPRRPRRLPLRRGPCRQDRPCQRPRRSRSFRSRHLHRAGQRQRLPLHPSERERKS